MPWCESCSKYYTPGSIGQPDRCPQCGDALEVGAVAHAHQVEQQAHAKVPWHFWVGVIAMVIYLGWRLIQAIVWAF